MDGTEFDKFADHYYEQHAANIAVTGESPEYFAEYKIRRLVEQARRRALPTDRVIDFGSGIGNSIPYFRRHMPDAQLFCADVSQRSLELAVNRFGDTHQSLLIDGQEIPADDGAFSIAFSACVFHHVPEGEHVHWLAELKRVTRSGGMLSIFEHNPLNPLTQRAVSTCPFDINARLITARQLARRCRLAGWRTPKIDYHLFFPRLFAALRPFEAYMSGIPLGGQYSVTAMNAR